MRSGPARREPAYDLLTFVGGIVGGEALGSDSDPEPWLLQPLRIVMQISRMDLRA